MLLVLTEDKKPLAVIVISAVLAMYEAAPGKLYKLVVRWYKPFDWRFAATVAMLDFVRTPCSRDRFRA